MGQDRTTRRHPIGVFDSGVGGLTVVRALRQVLPGEGGTTRWVVVGSDEPALQKVANVLGLAG